MGRAAGLWAFCVAVVCLVSSSPAQAALVDSVTLLGVTPDGASTNGFSWGGTSNLSLGSFGVSINPSPSLAANPQALAAFNRAASQWAGLIADPISVNINADLLDLGNPNIIGQANSVLLQAGYTTIRNAMVADAANEVDDSIVAFLPTFSQVLAIVPIGFTLSSSIVATKANVKALGFSGLDSTFGALDGTISFNSQFSFDFDNSDGISPGLVDFETVAAHEMGHVLGFTSGVDEVDFLRNQNQTGSARFMPLDLFRFRNGVVGQDPATPSEFTTFPRLMAPGGDAITDEIAAEHRMSTGEFFGDGRQASHWKDNALSGLLIGVMDPTLPNQTVIPVGAADFRALDLIGYDITPGAQVPAPGTLVLVGVGLLGLLTSRRGQRRKPAVGREGQG